jgi:glycosyltransferase involved in cell wall biosynthesis
MNILILTTHLNPGGISRYVVNLAKGLRHQDVVWVASAGGEWVGQLESNGISHQHLPIRTKSVLSIKIVLSFFLLIPFIVKNKIEIICANTRVTQCLAYLIYRALGIRYVSVFHGFYKSRLGRRMFKFEGERAIAVSQAVADHLHNDLAIASNKIKVIYNGIDREVFERSSTLKEQSGFSEDDLVLGILGRLSQEKGHLLVLRTFKRLKTKFKNVYLLFSGEGKLKSDLTHYIEKEQLADHVKFVGFKAEDFLDLIDILVVASSQEGFGYSILEAFAKEVCVVGFSVGGIREIIKDRETGFLFYEYSSDSLMQVLEEAIKNKPLQKEIVARAKEKLPEFDLENTINNTKKLFQEVLST